MSKNENVGIGAVWMEMGVLVDKIICINQDGDMCRTPLHNGKKNGRETVHNLNGKTFTQVYRDGLLPNGKPF